MRKWSTRLAIFAAIVSTAAYAEHIDLDLRDYDDDLMRDLDKAIKYFEPDITAGNQEAAKEDAEILEEGFRYTADYFHKKGPYEDAVKISQEGLDYIKAALKSVSQNDFAAAATAAQGAAKTCRSCHDIYKPLNKK